MPNSRTRLLRQANLVSGLCFLALILSYAGVGLATLLGASYEMLGYGLHPGLCVALAFLSMAMGIAGYCIRGRG